MAAKKHQLKLDQTKVVTTGTVVRIEAPQSSRHQPHVTVTSEYIPGSGFIRFLREHAIVGLAIGFVIGTQIQVLVKQLVDSFINPAFQLLFGEKLASYSFVLSFHGRQQSFTWGSFAYGLLNFLFILVVVYSMVKFLKLDRLDKPKKPEVAAVAEAKQERAGRKQAEEEEQAREDDGGDGKR